MLKKKICFLWIIIMILGIHIDVLAFDLDTSINTQILEEKKIEITLKLSDLEDYTNGINVVSGKLKYDSDVFDNVSFTGMNNWTCAYNNEKGNDNEGKFILMTTAGNVKADTEVAKIKLELKSDINNLKTKIKIQEIETSYQAEKINTEDKEFNFIIVDNTIKLAENNKEEEKAEESISESENVSVQNDVVAQKKDNYYIVIFLVLAIILFIILVILIINRKRRGRNEK
ncbi:MAG: hypothetical protein ACI4VH_02295 [Clostridia bacterium]